MGRDEIWREKLETDFFPAAGLGKYRVSGPLQEFYKDKRSCVLGCPEKMRILNEAAEVDRIIRLGNIRRKQSKLLAVVPAKVLGRLYQSQFTALSSVVNWSVAIILLITARLTWRWVLSSAKSGLEDAWAYVVWWAPTALSCLAYSSPIIALRIRTFLPRLPRLPGIVPIALSIVCCLCLWANFVFFTTEHALPMIVARLVVRQFPIQAFITVFGFTLVLVLLRARILPRSPKVTILSALSTLALSYFLPRWLPFYWCQHLGLLFVMLWMLRVFMGTSVVWAGLAWVNDWRKFRTGTIGRISIRKRIIPGFLVIAMFVLERFVMSRYGEELRWPGFHTAFLGIVHGGLLFARVVLFVVFTFYACFMIPQLLRFIPRYRSIPDLYQERRHFFNTLSGLTAVVVVLRWLVRVLGGDPEDLPRTLAQIAALPLLQQTAC